jgi:hypothetical protein
MVALESLPSQMGLERREDQQILLATSRFLGSNHVSKACYWNLSALVFQGGIESWRSPSAAANRSTFSAVAAGVMSI